MTSIITSEMNLHDNSRLSSPTINSPMISGSETPLYDQCDNSNMSFGEGTEIIEEHPEKAYVEFCGPNNEYVKKPMNPYMFFSRAERKNISRSHPELKVNEVSREMGDRWKKLTEKEKLPYVQMAKKQLDEHKKFFKENPDKQYLPAKKKPVAANKTQTNTTTSYTNSPRPQDSALLSAIQRPSSVITNKSIMSTPISTQQRVNGSSYSTPNQGGNVVYYVPPKSAHQSRPEGYQIAQSNGSSNQYYNTQTQNAHTIRYTATNGPPNNQNYGSPMYARIPQQTTQKTAPELLDLYYTSLTAPLFPHYLENQSNPLGLNGNGPMGYLDEYLKVINNAMNL
uniref:Sex-determining region Y protein n=1 Tax=Parastrongyloides trichosuri TaxID=131310 RepID=A0A0N4ZMB6_PARTI